MRTKLNRATAVVVVCLASFGSRSIRAEGEVSQWCLEDRQGLVATDALGNRDGDLVNMEGAWIPGRIGTAALRFDGEDDHVVLSSELDFDLDFTQSFSWSAWFRTEEEFGGTILAKSGDFWSEGAIALFVYDGMLAFDVGFVGAVFGEDTAVADGEWHHAILSVDIVEEGDEPTVTTRLYLDGEPVGFSEDLNVVEFGPQPGAFKLGYGSEDFPEEQSFWSGDLDDARTFELALDDESALELYEASRDDPSECGEGCDCEPIVCDGADTTCASVELLEGPEDNLPGIYVFQVDAEDANDGTILYELTATSDLGEVTISQSGEDLFDLPLFDGTWTISVEVIDDTFCPDDEPGSCSLEGFVVEPFTGNLVGNFCMEELSGNTVSDSVNDVSGELVNAAPVAAWVPGVPLGEDDLNDGALRLNGDEQYVVVPNAEFEFNFIGSYSVSAWVRLDSFANNTIFSTLPVDADDTLDGAQVFVVRDGTLGLDVGGVDFAAGEIEISDGEWHHVVLTVQKDAVENLDRVQFWVDGEPDTVMDDWDIQIIDPNDPASIGSDVFKIGGGASIAEFGHLVGEIDNFQFFDFPLGAAAIRELFESPGGGCDAGPPPACEEGPDTHCTSFEIEGPEGDITGLWTLTAEAMDEGGDPILYTFRGESEEDSFTIVQFDEPIAEVLVPEGEWSFTVTVDDHPLCEDESDDATCEPVERTVEGIPEELVAAFCLEDDLDAVTVDSVNGLEAQLLVFPEGIGDGTAPEPTDGLLEGSETALSFDGIEDAMVLAPTPRIGANQSYTIAAWIQVGEDPISADPDADAGTVAMIGPPLGEPGDTPSGQTLFVHEGVLKYHIGFCCEAESEEELPVVADGEPHHVAVSVEMNFEDGLDYASIWVDAQFAGEVEGDFQVDGFPEESVLKIGYSADDWPSADFQATNGGDINHFNGIIDNVKVWSFALEEDAIIEEFEEGNPSCEEDDRPPEFRRGDTDGNGEIEISDPIANLSFQFLGIFQPPCMDAADLDDNGTLEIGDPIINLTFQFLGTAMPAPPLEECGGDPSEDELGCEEFAPCE